ncbi:hypothetical protein HPP92_005333 [Vanilla planifolia]|uniref:Uncharacterized protein n=1 Tax=Vanilla planifolia TaxID=51239 RepID=A0A835VCI7_VANPL|nr:hypothetical protein HPP92_005333 [Vanilla planifolia]
MASRKVGQQQGLFKRLVESPRRPLNPHFELKRLVAVYLNTNTIIGLPLILLRDRFYLHDEPMKETNLLKFVGSNWKFRKLDLKRKTTMKTMRMKAL